ncbi:MAG: hypothetical protein ACJ0BH_04695 [Candidatus Puniceispirillaceae bacterium]
MKTVAVHVIKRAYSDTTKTLSRAGVSTDHEAQERIGLMKAYMRPVYAGGSRHVADLQQMEFPVWSHTISKQTIQKPAKG